VLAFDSYFNYAGPFEVRGDVVVHKVRYALTPNFVGTEQVRKITLESGKLTLSAEEMDAKGVKRLHQLVWKRQA
jgi:Cu/Ag efflux protein CusF